MARVLPEHVVSAILKVRDMTPEETTRKMEDLCEEQPVLVASAIATRKFGVSDQNVDWLLRLLLLQHEAATATGAKLPATSSEAFEGYLNQVIDRMRITDGMPQDIRRETVKAQCSEHAEPYLLAHVISELNLHPSGKFESKADNYFAFAALALVEAVSQGLAAV